jgi:DNA-binding transcriptional LysR family regulator
MHKATSCDVAFAQVVNEAPVTVRSADPMRSGKLDLTSLQLFVAVCDAKSITHAAEVEGIAASAVSKRITQLETYAGSALLQRTRTGVVPTKAGLTLLDHARNILSNVELVERDLSKNASELRGFVRVFASASAIAEFVPACVVSFFRAAKHRDIDIQIEEMTSNDIVAGVRDGLAALGIVWMEVESGGLEWIPYKRDHLALITPEKHPLADKRHIRFVETLDFEHAGLRPTSAVTALLRRESARAARTIRYRVLVSTFEAQISVVRSGLVVGVVPMEIAEPYAKAAGIRVIPLADPWAERQFGICCRNRRSLPKPAAQFLSHLLSVQSSD